MIHDAFGVLPIHAHDMGIDDDPLLHSWPLNLCSSKSWTRTLVVDTNDKPTFLTLGMGHPSQEGSPTNLCAKCPGWLAPGEI